MTVALEVNSFERLIVTEDLRRQGIDRYEMRPGNDCVWVSYKRGSVGLECYYIFSNGKLVDVQFD